VALANQRLSRRVAGCSERLIDPTAKHLPVVQSTRGRWQANSRGRSGTGLLPRLVLECTVRIGVAASLRLQRWHRIEAMLLQRLSLFRRPRFHIATTTCLRTNPRPPSNASMQSRTRTPVSPSSLTGRIAKHTPTAIPSISGTSAPCRREMT